MNRSKETASPAGAHKSVEIWLLGDCRFTEQGVPLEQFGYDKVRALFAFLTAEPRPHRREALAAIFWPDQDSEGGRRNLRTALSYLRRALGGGAATLLRTDRQNIRFATENCRVDAADLEGTPAEFTSHDAARRAERILARYRGPLLDGIALPGCDEFEFWLESRREALRQKAIALAEGLSRYWEQEGDIEAAARHAQRLTELEPLDENAHRRAMRLLASAGRGSEALAQFEHCRTALQTELGVQPGEETLALQTAVRDGTLTPAARQSAQGLPRERRQVTALSAELICPSATDIEERAAALEEVRQRAEGVVRRLGGHLTADPGGGLAAYFGYPTTREDAARQAIRAALRVARTAEESGVVQTRIGIHTGLTVSGEGLPDHAGLAISFSARLAGMARSGRVVVSEATWRLTGGFFDCTSLGERGFHDAEPLRLFEVNGETGAADRLEAVGTLTPFQGRQGELRLLNRLLRGTGTGGRVALVEGEPGVGKSRLVAELKVRLEGREPIREARCFRDVGEGPASAALELLRSLLSGQEGDEHATVAVIEDVHWADTDTRELLERLMAAPVNGVLLLLTSRPEHDLQLPATVTHLKLGHLGREENIAIIDAIPGGRVLPSVVRERILTLTEGIPLFTEEMTRMAVEATAARSSAPTLPETLQELLQARLDRLGAAARAMAQLAATLGRRANMELLRACAGEMESAPLEGIEELIAAGILTTDADRRGGTLYQFRHALIQEAAYHSQLRSVRRERHRTITAVLNGFFPELVSARPEMAAYHMEAAKAYPEATRLWLQAGDQARQRGALGEAARHYRSGQECLQQSSPHDADDTLDFDLSLGLCAAVSAGDSGATATYGIFEKTLALCRDGDRRERFSRVLWEIGMQATSRGSEEIAALSVRVLERLGEPDGSAWHRAACAAVRGALAGERGDMHTARRAMETALSGDALDAALRTPILAYLAVIRWYLGDLEESAAAWAAIKSESTAGDRAALHLIGGYLAVVHGRRDAACRHAAAAQIAAANEPARRGPAQALFAWSRAAEGRKDALRQLHEAAEAQSVGAVWRNASLLLIADGYRLAGDTEAALSMIERALDWARESRARHHEAELNRMKGELLAASGAGLEAAERCLVRALALASEQNFRSLELRAASGLARIRHAQGREREARDLLAPIVSWFSGAPRSADLQAAEDLLEALG